jgi:beta-phosphoglucomutase-like phosphatase (HAD superfamily)
MIKRLAIFDFDGTLKDTHDNVNPDFLSHLRFSTDPEEIKRYNQRSLEWLSSVDSMVSLSGGDPWIEENVQAAREAYSDPQTLSVLMTARGGGAKEALVQLLQEKGLRFNEYIFKREMIIPETGETRYLNAPEFKARETTTLIERLGPHLEVVEVFEDSEENIEAIGSVVPPDVEYIPHLEETRREIRSARKQAHKRDAALVAKARKQFYADLESRQINEWRTSGDPPLPGAFNKGAPKKKKAPHDATYGSEPDLLDKPGVIVEPDVRKKISDYFTKMKLREFVREMIRSDE